MRKDINKELISYKIREISKSKKNIHEEIHFAKTRYEQDKRDFANMV